MLRLIIITIFVSLILTGCEAEQSRPPLDLNKLNWGLEAQITLQQAESVYQETKNQDTDLSNGPCLSNALHGNPDYPETMWVLDIAHNPREAVDDLPANQCSAYRDGQAKNFIELDSNGQVIRVYSPFLPQR